MGEYQLYEFLAIDRPLTEEEQEAVSSLSSRVEPHPWRARFVYHYSGFHGDPLEVLARYYDAMLYMANWGSRQLVFRFPAALVDVDELQQYESPVGYAEPISVFHVGKYVLLDIQFHPEGESEWLDGEGSLDRLVALRGAVLRRDYRLLYLAWLKSLLVERVDREAPEPPLPPGMRALTPELRSFIEIFGIDEDILEVAVGPSGDLPAISENDLHRGIATLSAAEKDDLLLRLARGEPQLAVALNRRLGALVGALPPTETGRRTAGELLDARRSRRQERRRQQKAAAEAARLAELAALAEREEVTWEEADSLVASYQPKAYDEATLLLSRLQELAAHRRQEEAFAERVARLADKYSRRPSFLDRLRTAGLIPGTPTVRRGPALDRRFAVLDDHDAEDEKDEGYEDEEYGEKDEDDESE
jgi:hypothetical protein